MENTDNEMTLQKELQKAQAEIAEQANTEELVIEGEDVTVEDAEFE